MHGSAVGAKVSVHYRQGGQPSEWALRGVSLYDADIQFSNLFRSLQEKDTQVSRGSLTMRLTCVDQLIQGQAHNLAKLKPRLFQGHAESPGKVWSEGLAEVNRVSAKPRQQGPHLATQR